ncbi:MAG TPA: M48 family metalloprotease [Novosphingobium sp.]|nr:M48 family metalloprotease [Novosphingobium sp.]
MPRNLKFALVGVAVTTLALPAGSGIAQTRVATQQVQSISAKDRQEGAQAHPQLIAEFGGAETGPQATYVEGIGKNIAIQSGLGNARSDFTVTLLNSPVDNAFAVPGGYIYVTRQLVALMNNEAELAGVLGHEIGHVAARHAAKRQSAATRNSILGVLGQVLAGAVLGNSAAGQIGQKLFGQGSQLLTLKFSRAQETEADNLGVSYLQRAGYDPRAMSTVLQSLANQNVLDARLMGSANQVPEWASTHPDPASRVRAALVRAGANATGITNRDTFLSRIDGLRYGDDPRQGVVEGRKFTHPEYRMTFDAPNGFFLMNGTRAVSISGQSGKGQFSTAAYSGSLESYIRSVFAGLTEQGQAQISPDTIQRTTVNGIPAAYGTARVTSNGSQVDVVVFAYEWSSDQAFHFLTISQAGSASTFNSMFSSMRRISVAEAAAVKPRKLVVVTARRGDTVQSLASRMAYADAPLDRFRVLNGLGANSTIVVGQKVKLVTY